MYSPNTVLAAIFLYIGLLLVVARWAERTSYKGKSLANNAVVYSFALAVYCTAWTYYGSVGIAATSGFLFLSIYLGPMIAISMWWIILRKLVRIKTAHRITSIADLISARYNRSQAIGALATLIAVVGIVPYIALQFRAIDSTFAIIAKPLEASSPWIGRLHGVGTVSLLVAFTIILGMRKLDPTERHPGMMMALAVESLVKLSAFLAAGIFVVYFMHDGLGDMLQRFSVYQAQLDAVAAKPPEVSAITWVSYTFLSFFAVMFLPRQFHVEVVENLDENHIKTAMWLFPVYMILINVFTYPIAVGGLLSGLPIHAADSFVLDIPVRQGQGLLSLFVFLGGFSAAAGMIMVESIAMSTMITNHFMLPLTDWFKQLGFLRRRLLLCRWVAVAGFIALGYWFQLIVGPAFMLVNIGLMSFAAVLQFVPAIIGGIFWRRSTQLGALLGLSTGFLVWTYTCLVPALVKSGYLWPDLLAVGPWGIEFLNPEHLFGLTELDPISHSVFWSMLFNTSLYVWGSLGFEQNPEESRQAQEFVDVLRPRSAVSPTQKGERNVELRNKRGLLESLLQEYFTPVKASVMIDQCLAELEFNHKSRISILELAELQNEVERNLAGSIGAAQAHRALKETPIFTPSEEKELSEMYGEILAELRITPEELKRKVDYYKERERLLADYAAELEQKVKEQTLHLETANKDLKDFAYVVSHDLKAPLRAISQLAGWIAQDHADALNSEGKQQIDLLLGRVRRMDNLIDGILQYSRIGRVVETEKQVDLNILVPEVIDLIAPPEDVKVYIDGLLPSIKCEETRLRQVFQNLIENAVKHMNKPGGEVRIACETENDQWRFSVADDGPGIDPKYHEKIFQMFQTLAPRDKIESTGIGLTLVKKIIELNGGKIWVESELGRGSVFFFTLPRNGRKA